MILFTDSMREVMPADSTMTAIIIALKYSMRPNPKGCLRSAGLCDSFAPMMVITLDRASLRLFSASIMMATLPEMIPTTALNATRNTLATIPTTLVRIILELLSMPYAHFSDSSFSSTV